MKVKFTYVHLNIFFILWVPGKHSVCLNGPHTGLAILDVEFVIRRGGVYNRYTSLI